MEKMKASLHMTLFTTCPECEEHINLFDQDLGLNDEGEMYKAALPEGNWSEEHEKFECTVCCPECSVEFDVKGIDW